MYKPSELAAQSKKLRAQEIWLEESITRGEIWGFNKLKTLIRINLSQRRREDLAFQIIMISKNYATKKKVQAVMDKSELLYNKNKDLIGRVKANASKN